MKIKPSTRVLAAVMAFIMVMVLVPFSPMTTTAVEGSGSSSTYVFDPDSQVALGADKDAIAAGTTYTDGFFTVEGTVTQRVKSDAVYCV